MAKWVTICEHDAAGRRIACHPVLIHDNGRPRPTHPAYRQLKLDRRQIAAAAKEHERRMRDERRLRARNAREAALLARQDAAYRRAAQREAEEEARQWRMAQRNFLRGAIRANRQTMSDKARGRNLAKSDEYRYLPRWVKTRTGGGTTDQIAEEFAERFPGSGVTDEDSLRGHIHALDSYAARDRRRSPSVKASYLRPAVYSSEEIMHEVAF